MRATSRTPSSAGSSQLGPRRTASGIRTVRTIAATTAPAIGQRGSPTTARSAVTGGIGTLPGHAAYL